MINEAADTLTYAIINFKVLCMKRDEVRDLIPVALQELHNAGHESVYADELGEQITSHDESFLARRDKLRAIFGKIGVRISPLPSGHIRPGAHKLYPSLSELEEAGIIVGAFEETPEDGRVARRKYSLVNPEDLTPRNHSSE